MPRPKSKEVYFETDFLDLWKCQTKHRSYSDWLYQNKIHFTHIAYKEKLSMYPSLLYDLGHVKNYVLTKKMMCF